MARNRYMVSVLLTFFVISLLTSILGPIVPDIISSFHGEQSRSEIPKKFRLARVSKSQ